MPDLYWHVNNAIGNAAAGREIGGETLTLRTDDGARFGSPSPAAPLRLSIFRDGSPLTILKCIGVEGDALTIDGTADGYDDAEVLAGDLVANVPTAGDFTELAELIARIRMGNAVAGVTDDNGDIWPAGLAGYLESTDPATVRVVDAAHGLPVVIVEPATVNQGGSWTVNLAEDATVALATGTVVGLASGATVGVEGPVSASQYGDWSVELAAGTALIGRTAAGLDGSAVYDGATALTPLFAKIAASASGDNEIVDAVAGKKIRVLRWGFAAGGDVTAKWRSGSTDLTGPRPLTKYAAAGGAPSPWGLFETAAGEALNLNLSAAVAVGGELTYVLI